MGIELAIFDFDGTCTRVEDVHDGFLDRYRELVGATPAQWELACDAVVAHSPAAGWNLNGAPSSAPAAADCYILAGEAAAWLLREGLIAAPQGNAFGAAAAANVAPFRPELAHVLAALRAKGVKIGFVSNSDPQVVRTRVRDALSAYPDVRDHVYVHGNAMKYAVREVFFEAKVPPVWREAFARLAPVEPLAELPRPVYLRRGAYFEALAAVWQHHGASDATVPAARTLVVGDIYELDLAMPKALGIEIHLIERTRPHLTYPYERAAVGAGRVSTDLEGVLARV